MALSLPQRLPLPFDQLGMSDTIASLEIVVVRVVFKVGTLQTAKKWWGLEGAAGPPRTHT
jgi:hypothetical protein